jgi:hypothetical protein
MRNSKQFPAEIKWPELAEFDSIVATSLMEEKAVSRVAGALLRFCDSF